MAQPLEGAWELVSDRQHGIWIFTDQHWSNVWALKDRHPAQNQPPSEPEAAELFRSMMAAAAGTHAISPSEGGWIRDAVAQIARYPSFEGTHMRYAARMDGGKLASQVVGADGARGEETLFRQLSGSGTSPLAGVYEMVSERRNGLLLQTDSHYALIETNKDRPQIEATGEELSDADAASLFRALSAQAGTYTVSGSVMTRRPVVAHNPQLQGVGAAVEFRLEGDTLRRFLPRPDGSTVEAVWRRVG